MTSRRQNLIAGLAATLSLVGVAQPAAAKVDRVLAHRQVSLPDGGAAVSTVRAGASSGTPKLSISPLYRYAPVRPRTVEVGSSRAT